MAIKLINILHTYDKDTKATLVQDMFELVYQEKKYTLKQFLNTLLNEWIPAWINDKIDDMEAIRVLENSIKSLDIVF